MFFVIGGSGFVGSAFCRILRQRAQPFEIITRANYNSFIGRGCDVLINANGNSRKFLAKTDPKYEFQASVVPVRNSLVDFRYSKYVFLSTGDVYPDCSVPELTKEDLAIDVTQQSTYGFHKYLAELCVHNAAKDWLVIRQGGFVGPGLKKNAIYDVLYGGKLWLHPESHLQFIHTDDSARMIIELIEKDISNEVINLTGTGTISASEIMVLVGRKLPYPENAVPIKYEISTEKASNLVGSRRTEEAVKNFITQVAVNTIV
jgi:nucleoside-diphosphate-sugar epimerase